MSIISGLIGNAAETDIEDVKKDYGPAKKSTTTPFPTRVSATSP